MNIIDTGYTRKLDTTGRLGIPTKLRSQFELVPAKEYSIFVIEDTESERKFIAIECPEVSAERIAEARRIVEKYGLK